LKPVKEVAVAKEIGRVTQAMGVVVVVGVGVLVARRAEQMGAVAVAKATGVVPEAMGVVAVGMGVAVARRAELLLSAYLFNKAFLFDESPLSAQINATFIYAVVVFARCRFLFLV